ncbi:MAG: FAD-dependent oxidoreductase [Tissierellia bacterium]|nr:FAD-dependent oxidoreductase [Tissierellia bacterium]
MYILRNIKLPIDHNEKDLRRKISEKIGTKNFTYEIYKRSLDARGELQYVYQCVIQGEISAKKIRRLNHDIALYQEELFDLKNKNKIQRAIIVGAGPAGLFAAYFLTQAGVEVHVIEQGLPMENRVTEVEKLLEDGILNPRCNVQFGEGGAGTFSDGKLTSRSKDKRQREIFKVLVQHGAPEEICYDHMPHIGTDLLRHVIVSIRKEIQRQGGVFHFDEKMEEITLKDGVVESITTDKATYPTEHLLLALGNSSRDTFEMLSHQLAMEAKPFAVGFRIEHPQLKINQEQYGQRYQELPPASYQLTYYNKEKNQRAYTFCMCPGGYVIAAASEEHHLCVNGMSYHKREGRNANSALLTPVDSTIYGSGILSGLAFQRRIEQKAYQMGGGNYMAPIQKIGDFLENKNSSYLGGVQPTYRPGTVFAPLHEIYPPKITENLQKGLLHMNRKLKGFAMEDGILTGVETRSSSPVRIRRDKKYRAIGVKNLYPIGEGAGYAGGIISSALDGVKCVLEILEGKEC